MITLTYERIMANLGLFTALCVAAGWLIKIIKAIKKPGDDINQKLDRDNKRIRKLEDEMEYISSAIGMLMRTNLVQLRHMRTGNETGEISTVEKEVQEFLIRN